MPAPHDTAPAAPRTGGTDPARPAGAREAPSRLRVRGLTVGFLRRGGRRDVVHDVGFDLDPGTCVALVGESGSGKSVTARTLVGLAGRDSVVEADELSLRGRDLRFLAPRHWRGLRGNHIGVVLQDALVSLDPLRPVGAEIGEALALHGWGNRAGRARRVLDLLEAVGVPDPRRRARQRPHELSGGLRQRALIASAIALDPEVVIADEPTTALDVSVQAQVLDELERMKQRGVAILLISHDLAVVARMADHVLVMKDGRVVEQGPARRLLTAAGHPYTRELVAAVPGQDTRGRRLAPGVDLGLTLRPDPGHVPPAEPDGPVLEASGLVKTFPTPDGGRLRAVDDVSFRLERGRTLGIVGESGSGKSTTARLALALEVPDAGQVTLLGRPWTAVPEKRRRASRRAISVVYQDPLSSFDPRWTTDRILLDAVEHEPPAGRPARVRELLHWVGLDEDVLPRFPLHLSGGQRQRVSIARALAGSPRVIVLDEAVSALDASVQAQVLDLLVDLQDRLGVSYLFISHDLGVIAHLSDEVLVMKDGAVVERGRPEDLFTDPAHPYTRQLVDALPSLDPSPTTRSPR